MTTAARLPAVKFHVINKIGERRSAAVCAAKIRRGCEELARSRALHREREREREREGGGGGRERERTSR